MVESKARSRLIEHKFLEHAACGHNALSNIYQNCCLCGQQMMLDSSRPKSTKHTERQTNLLLCNQQHKSCHRGSGRQCLQLRQLSASKHGFHVAFTWTKLSRAAARAAVPSAAARSPAAPARSTAGTFPASSRPPATSRRPARPALPARAARPPLGPAWRPPAARTAIAAASRTLA